MHLLSKREDASQIEIYKTLKPKSGVYIFINNITKYTSIGSSVNLRRIAVHIFHAGSNKETTLVCYRAMRKYGLENFSLVIIEFCTPDLASCLELEQKWIVLGRF